tara:strand:- start:3099 stop:5831 length:2733 start_codon:yes stop_codon:yes gene_type:complete
LKFQVIITSVLLAAGEKLSADSINFVRDIRPIFEAKCYRCHGAEKQKSGLRLDMHSGAFGGGEFHQPTIIPGKANESNLIRFVRGDDEEIRMPPKGSGLTKDEIATLTAWVNQGADWPKEVDLVKSIDRTDHWSFKPLALFDSERNIDFFVKEKLVANGLLMSPSADRLTWLRRVFFDLIGLPPTPEQVAAFLIDTDPTAHERVVDQLLSSPRYGERWAQHWLDVVRYADTHGFEVNTPRSNAWPYRDYVIEAFNNDTPFDQFIREQLAGDQFGKDPATGFLVTAARLLPGQIGADAASKRLARQDELGEIVINTSEAFLGLSVGCARCHNHKFDAILAKDYYSMQAFFAGVSYGDRTIQSPESQTLRKEAEELKSRVREIDRAVAGLGPLAKSGVIRPPVSALLNVERFTSVKARKVRFTIKKTNQYEPCLDELEVFDLEGNNIALSSSAVVRSASGSKVEANRHQLEFINDGEFGNERSWMCSETSGWVMLEFPSEQTIERIAWARDRNGKYSDRLAVEYVIEVANDSSDWQVVADSTDRRLGDGKVKADFTALDPEQQGETNSLLEEKKGIESRLAELSRAQTVFGGIFGKPEPMFLLNRGDAEQPKEEVAPAVLSAFGDITLTKDAPDAERRLALANWIATSENPLTARVAVNRIWQGHFGIGLVETANDFGRVGAAPSHPKLLDWLAAEFIRSGWSVKHLHRLIVLSETYRQSEQINAVAQAKDAVVRLLWRFPSRRLEAESIRDAMLSVSGRLDLKIGGPGFDLFTSRGGLSGFPPITKFKGDGLRRMIYAHKIRMEPDSIFGAFDCPDAGQSVSRRRQSTTPIQALNLFNSQFTIDESKAFAQRVRDKVGQEVDAQITYAYELAYGRSPDPDELVDTRSVVRQHGLSTLCRAIFNSSEFLFIP